MVEDCIKSVGINQEKQKKGGGTKPPPFTCLPSKFMLCNHLQSQLFLHFLVLDSPNPVYLGQFFKRLEGTVGCPVIDNTFRNHRPDALNAFKFPQRCFIQVHLLNLRLGRCCPFLLAKSRIHADCHQKAASTEASTIKDFFLATIMSPPFLLR